MVFIEEGNERLGDRIYKPAGSQDFTQGPIRILIKLTTTTAPVSRFVKQPAGRDVASEAKFIQDITRQIEIKEERTPPPPLVGHNPKSLKNSNGVNKDKNKNKPSPYHRFSYYYCSKLGSCQYPDNYKADKY